MTDIQAFLFLIGFIAVFFVVLFVYMLEKFK